VTSPGPALLLSLAGVASALHAGRAAAQTCAAGWSDHFSPVVLSTAPGSNGPYVSAQAVYDDGSGPALIIGGHFDRAGGNTANNIARWDGHSLSPLGLGLTGSAYGAVNALASFDPDGAGPMPAMLIAQGIFDQAGGAPADGLAAWDGHNWTAIPHSEFPYGASIQGIKVVDADGSGPLAPLLYASISYLWGSPEVYYVGDLWTWDGVNWAQLASRIHPIGSMEFFTPGLPGAAPAALYCGQSYYFSSHSYCITASSLNRFDPPNWVSLLNGQCESYEYCANPMCSGQFPGQTAVFNPNGSGGAPPLLVVQGGFSSIGGTVVHNLAAYDGVSWSAFGGDGDGVRGIFALTDPATLRPSLYASGNNFTVGGIPALSLARYDATGWTAIPNGLVGSVSSMVPFTTPGALPAIYVSGPSMAGIPVQGWARLTSIGWAPIGQCLNNQVHALGVYVAPGGSPALYAGGAFTAAAGQFAVGLARWDGTQWSPAVNLNNHVDCMTPFDAYLAIGGKFTLGGLATGGVGLYDGHGSVLPLGTGMDAPVHALCVFNSQLYAGGEFTIAGGTSALGIARWNGSAWTALGPPGSGTDNHVDAIAAFDDGGGSALYVGGKFASAGGIPASHIARWDGVHWSVLPGGGTDDNIEALTVVNDGSGPALYAGGSFTHAGAIPAAHIARYRGGVWTAVGTGTDGEVRALCALDPDGPGPGAALLMAGGDFESAGGAPSPHAALWNGSAWEAMGPGVGGSVNALAAFSPNAAAAPSAFLGGAFLNAGVVSSPFMAQWTRCPPCYPNCDASTTPPTLNVLDFVCFLNRFAAADTYANCDASTTPPVLNVLDFTCFLNRFAAGCS
jgi:hypothetical protein